MQISDSAVSAPRGSEPWVQRRWLLALAAAVLPFLLLAYYNYPSIHDDYSNSNRIIRLGRMQFIRDLYHNCTGRYTKIILKDFYRPAIAIQVVRS